jgi:hypothetical protein
MKKLEEIARAWITAVNPNEEEKSKALTRSAVCDGCVKKTYNETLRFYYCTECTCPLTGKIYSPVNSCPLKKWEI